MNTEFNTRLPDLVISLTTFNLKNKQMKYHLLNVILFKSLAVITTSWIFFLIISLKRSPSWSTWNFSSLQRAFSSATWIWTKFSSLSLKKMFFLNLYFLFCQSFQGFLIFYHYIWNINKSILCLIQFWLNKLLLWLLFVVKSGGKGRG